MFQCLLPLTAPTQVRDNPSCKSSFLDVHLAQGVTFWVPTHAPQPLVTRPGSVSTILSYHAHGSPLGVALSWVVSVSGVSQRWRGYFTSQVTPHWYWEYGLEATFLFSLLLFWGTEAPHGVAPSMVFSTRGYRGWHRRRLNLATPHLGDAYTWRRLYLATPTPGGALSGQPVDFLPWAPLRGPTICWLWLWLWLWSMPGDETVHKPPVLSSHLFQQKD